MGLLRLLVMGLFVYIGYRIIKALLAPKTPAHSSGAAQTDEETVRDPVCGIYLTKHDAVVGALNGDRYYFCSMNCLEKYREQLDHTHETITRS